MSSILPSLIQTMKERGPDDSGGGGGGDGDESKEQTMKESEGR